MTIAGQLPGLVGERSAAGDHRSPLGLVTRMREGFQRMDAADYELPRIGEIIAYIDKPRPLPVHPPATSTVPNIDAFVRQFRYPAAGAPRYTTAVQRILEFPEVLRLIEDRSAAFRAAIASAPDLDVQIPTCPDWTLRELAQHLGDGRRRQAAIVAAGPGAEPPARTDPKGAPTAPRDHEALDARLAESTELMLAAMREAGPDRGCWTWWGRSQAPETSGAVARHQMQEIALHTYDAQLAQGAAQPLPTDVAVEGVDEFLTTISATTVPWPFKPATIDLHTTEGRSWRLTLNAAGVRCDDLAADAEPGDMALRGAASDLVLSFYERVPLDVLETTGDTEPLEQLAGWDPDA